MQAIDSEHYSPNSVEIDGATQPFCTETLASDAIERWAQWLGVAAALDDPEQAQIAAVERAIKELLHRVRSISQTSSIKP